MSTAEATVTIPDPEPTLRDLAYQAASATKLDSFAGAYAPEADKANRIAATFFKTYPETTSGNPCLCIVNIYLGFVLNISYGNLPHIM